MVTNRRFPAGIAIRALTAALHLLVPLGASICYHGLISVRMKFTDQSFFSSGWDQPLKKGPKKMENDEHYNKIRYNERTRSQ